MHLPHTFAILSLNPLDARSLIQTFGLVGVLAILFAETGLLVGFFLPGDSLLFLAGVAASPAAADIFGVRLPLVALRDTIGAANIDKYLLPVVAVIILLSLIPIGVEVLRAHHARTADREVVDEPPAGGAKPS